VWVGWDTDGMRSTSAVLLDRAANLDGAAADVTRAGVSAAPPIDAGRLVVAARWCRSASGDLRMRATMLDEARVEWAARAGTCLPSDRPNERLEQVARLHAEQLRILERLERLEGRDEVATHERRLAELEAVRLRLIADLAASAPMVLPGPRLDPEELRLLAAALDRRLTALPPAQPADPKLVARSIAVIRSLLDESWFGDVSRDELLEIERVLGGLAGPELDLVVAALGEAELARWLHELDGVRGGNLDASEETRLFTMLARKAGAATLWRLVTSEGAGKLAEVTGAVLADSPPPVVVGWVELAATEAAESDEALLAAVAALERLDEAFRTVAVIELAAAGTLDPLLAAAADLARRLDPGRDGSILTELFEGAVDGMAGVVTGLAGLTIVGLWDREDFRRNWSSVAGLGSLLFADPAAFFGIVADVEMLRANPARWAGSLTPDAIASFVGGGLAAKLARRGVLGVGVHGAMLWLDEVALDARALRRILVIDEAGAIRPTGLRVASEGLRRIFDGGSVRGRFIPNLRKVLLDDGFSLGRAARGAGYLFEKGLEEVRIMRRNGGWDVRMRNRFGNDLDEWGNVAPSDLTHGIEVFPK